MGPLDLIASQNEAEEEWADACELITNYVVEKPYSFKYETMRALLRLANLCLRKMLRTILNQERLKTLRGAQIWLSRHARERTINKLLLILPDCLSEKILAVNVSIENYNSGMIFPPTQTTAEREVNLMYETNGPDAFDTTRVSEDDASLAINV